MTTPTHRVLLAPTLDLALTVDADVTIEAEFGSTVIEGRVATFAHHVPSAAHNPSPCANGAVDRTAAHLKQATVLLSHIDLDSIGGALRALGELPNWPLFWALAGAVDVRGPHRLEAALDAVGATGRERKRLVDALRGFWAWSRSRPRLPRDVVSDVTAEVMAARDILDALCATQWASLEPRAEAVHWIQAALRQAALRATQWSSLEPSAEATRWIQAGRDAAVGEDALEASSRRQVVTVGDVRIVCREADQFVAALHRVGHDTDVAGTASRDTRSGAITIALADPVPGVSCAAVARALWGPDAGGHAGIAGSPRGQVMPDEDLVRAATALAEAVAAARDTPVEVPPTPERWIPARRSDPEGGWECSMALRAAAAAIPRPDGVRTIVLDLPPVQWGTRERVDVEAPVLGVTHRLGERGERVTVPLGTVRAVRLPVPEWVWVPDEPSLAPAARWLTAEEADAAWSTFAATAAAP